MALLDIFKPKAKDFFSEADKKKIVDTIQYAERRTSGEVRVFVESRCKYMDAIDRAAEVFFNLQMEKTEQRNATLVYVALKDKQVAVFGDEGIYKKTGQPFWHWEMQRIIRHLGNEQIAQGIIDAVRHIGEALHEHFPYDAQTDKNELPDEIVFGS